MSARIHRVALVLGILGGLAGIASWFASKEQPITVPARGLEAKPAGNPETFLSEKPSTDLTPRNRPVEWLTQEYVGAQACRECHLHNHETWHASYHRTMTQVPTPENVVADFDDVTLETFDETYRLTTEDDRFYVEMKDPIAAFRKEPGKQVRREIVLMTGSHHEQDFWFDTHYGRQLGRLPFVYRIDEKKWIPDVSVLVIPPGSPHGFGDWNTNCIQCHTTLGRPRTGSGPADSRVAEFGISCEACHGPGEAHVLRHRALAQREKESPDHDAPIEGEVLSSLGVDRIVNPAKLTAHQSAQVCGQCHGVFMLGSGEKEAEWSRQGFLYRPGDELRDSRVMIQVGLLDEQPVVQQALKDHPTFFSERFWPDGTVRVLGREYTGLIESPCHLQGEMTCLSCHTLHPAAEDPRPLKEWADDQLRLGMRGNQACLQCHSTIENDLVAHTHHPADSSGSLCYNCHMPKTAFGLLKAAHSHRVESPSVATSVATGRPNGCNLCHLDKSLGWTNHYLTDWYNLDSVELTNEQAAVPASLVWALSGDAGQRALMAWAMGWAPTQEVSGQDWQARFLSQLLIDPYDAVRIIAHRSLKSLDGFETFEYDFNDPPEIRIANQQQAMDQWRRQRQEAGKSLDLQELLDASAESITTEIYDELLNRRDDRALYLAE